MPNKTFSEVLRIVWKNVRIWLNIGNYGDLTMKLNELDAQRRTATVARIIESHLGKRIDFDSLGRQQVQHLLSRVRELVSEHRQTVNFHSSERNPSYLKLVMMEQALSSRLDEMQPPPMAIDVNDPKVKQTMQKASNGQTLNPDEQKTMTAIALMKKESKKASKKRVMESELQQAQVVLASQDMLDRVQKMTEDISEMQFKDLPALVDSIKNDMGTEQATQFQAQASAALSTLLSALQQGKTQLEAAQGSITGSAAPVVPGEETDAVDADADLDLDATGDMGLDANLDVEADVEAEPEPEEPEPKAALGRARR